MNLFFQLISCRKILMMKITEKVGALDPFKKEEK